MLGAMVKDTHFAKDKLTRKWEVLHDPNTIAPTEFDSAAATLSQLIMQFHDNSDAPNPNTGLLEVFYELLSSGKFKGQNLAVYLVAKIIQLDSCGDEAEYIRLRSLLDSITFSTEQGDRQSQRLPSCIAKSYNRNCKALSLRTERIGSHHHAKGAQDDRD